MAKTIPKSALAITILSVGLAVAVNQALATGSRNRHLTRTIIFKMEDM
jgi:hypothetical protein